MRIILETDELETQTPENDRRILESETWIHEQNKSETWIHEQNQPETWIHEQDGPETWIHEQDGPETWIHEQDKLENWIHEQNKPESKQNNSESIEFCVKFYNDEDETEKPVYRKTPKHVLPKPSKLRDEQSRFKHSDDDAWKNPKCDLERKDEILDTNERIKMIPQSSFEEDNTAVGKASVKKFFPGKKYEFNEFNMDSFPERLNKFSPPIDKSSDISDKRPGRVPRVLQSSHSDSDDVVYVLENRDRLFSSHSTRIRSSRSTPGTPRNPDKQGVDLSEKVPEDRLLSRRTRRTRSGAGTSRSYYEDAAESCDSGISVSETRFVYITAKIQTRYRVSQQTWDLSTTLFFILNFD